MYGRSSSSNIHHEYNNNNNNTLSNPFNYSNTDHPEGWRNTSWKQKPIKQQPEYPDDQQLKNTLKKIYSLPALVHESECDQLKNRIASAQQGKMFVLQGGDCAERFMDCTSSKIEAKFKMLLQMSLIITTKSRIPVVRIGRIAGQFAKPRSETFEMVPDSQEKVYSFKGDNVNGFETNDRVPNPDRLLQAYFHSAATLNYVRAMIGGGVANLHDANSWKFGKIKDPERKKQYEQLVESILGHFSFLSIWGADQFSEFNAVELYTSHEGLILEYESALTEPRRNGFYNLGAHFLWIGDRTRELNGAHIEYFRGIKNPIGVKVGPSMKPEELQELVKTLNPKKEAGRLTLISRYGADNIKTLLPAHIKAVQETGIPVLWISDPCHGNTQKTKLGVKTRRYDDVLRELESAFDIHASCGSQLGGVHLELTGDDVTECIGGSEELNDDHLSEAYETYCDPRLNYTQSLDIAFSIAQKFEKIKSPRPEYHQK